MADLSITAANVVAASDASLLQVTAGETITAGQPVYKDTADNNEYKLCDHEAQASAVVAGVALNGASDGQPMRIITTGNLNPGATVTVGEIYCASGSVGTGNAAGGICPEGDLASGDFVTVLGIGTTTSNIAIDIQVSGVAVP